MSFSEIEAPVNFCEMGCNHQIEGTHIKFRAWDCGRMTCEQSAAYVKVEPKPNTPK